MTNSNPGSTGSANDDDDDTWNGQQERDEVSLQDRIEELEVKLAVLSRILQRSISPPRVPPLLNDDDDDDGCVSPVRPSPSDAPAALKRSSSSTTPHLESPAPLFEQRKRHYKFVNNDECVSQDASSTAFIPRVTSDDDDSSSRPTPLQRNLSLTLLYEGDQEAYEQQHRVPSPPHRHSLTPSEASVVHKEESDSTLSSSHHTATTSSIRNKWLDYMNSVQELGADVDTQMQEFIQVPGNLEALSWFGFWICVDSFLYMTTILPIRFVWSCWLLIITGISKAMRRNSQNVHRFHRRHLYQLIQVLQIFIVYMFLHNASIGKLYHWIRGQAMIKLYVILAMVEIFDRLFSSLGQDCLDSMYWNTVSRPGSKRFLVSVLVVCVYASLHTGILFVHVATLNVAMNSADQALLTLLISGNFAEIKSTVFKKYNKAALFKLTVSDICERFKLVLFLSLVLLLNICQGMEYSQFVNYGKTCGIVLTTELLADWIKHAFIVKFNILKASCYPEYELLLAGDVTGFGHEELNLDHSHAVVKRIGFAQMPLIIVMLKFVKEAAKYAKSSWPSKSFFCVFWIVLVITKVGLGSLLQRISSSKLHSAPEYSQKQQPLVKQKQH